MPRLIAYQHALLDFYLWKGKSGAVNLVGGGEEKVGRTKSRRGRGGCGQDLVH